jgi:hypothetical protein
VTRFQTAERVSATRLSLLRAAHARESKFLLGDMTTRQTETLVDLQKSVHLQLGRLARQDGKSQAAVNAITAVQKIEGSIGSDEANDEFGHVLWDQKEHALAIQHIEQMTRTVESNTKSNGRLAVLLARNVSYKLQYRGLTSGTLDFGSQDESAAGDSCHLRSSVQHD